MPSPMRSRWDNTTCNNSRLPLLLAVLLQLAAHLQHTSAIVQGTADTTNAWGKVCALVQQNQGGGYDATCTAVLINPSTLLSAAHCAEQFTHVSCDGTISGTPQILDVLDRQQHPTYRAVDVPEADQQDLLLVKLIQGYTPSGGVAALPPSQLLNDLNYDRHLGVDSAFTVVGFGGTRPITDPSVSEAGRSENKDRHYTSADFNALYRNQLLLSVSLSKGTGGSVCRGDSGGPVFYAPTGVLVGILSRADLTCNRNAVANRVDTNPVRSWLALQGVMLP